MDEFAVARVVGTLSLLERRVLVMLLSRADDATIQAVGSIVDGACSSADRDVLARLVAFEWYVVRRCGYASNPQVRGEYDLGVDLREEPV
jgi:hypothetical protein